MSLDRRRIVQFHVTISRPAHWTAQQGVEAFPLEPSPRFPLRDRDMIYGRIFVRRLESMGIGEVVTAPEWPRQNPRCVRLSGSSLRYPQRASEAQPAGH
jgi:hypothetical protein